MTIDEFILAVGAAADEALPPAARALFGPSVEPPPSAAEVTAFEAEIGVTLPDDYSQFLLRCNGGRLDWFQYAGPTPDGKTWQAVIREVGGLREESDLSPWATASHPSAASRRLARTSSSVSPCVWQPGRAGMEAEYPPASGSGWTTAVRVTVTSTAMGRVTAWLMVAFLG